MRLITVHGRYHGLGNRLRVLLGGVSLARLSGREFGYHWPVNADFGAALTELWEFDQPSVAAWRVALARTRHPLRGADLEWLETAGDDTTWLIRTPHELHLPAQAESWTQLLRDLRPVPAIAERIAGFHADYLAGTPYIGVMIRAAAQSHQATRDHSPVSWFVDQLTAVRAEHPGMGFFVSCDVPAVSAELRDRFDRCFYLTDKGDYNSRTALQASVADLYLLAGATSILGPHYSSFPELAHHLAGGGIELRTSQERRGDSARLSLVTDPLRPAATRIHW
jgi:hypothetical protein